MRNILFLMLLGYCSFIYAQTRTWNGLVSNDWNDNLNWTPAVVPGAMDNVVINNGSLPNYPVIPTGGVTILSLTMSAGSINLNGETLTISGAKNSVLSGGTISSGTLSFNIASSNNLTFSGTFTSNAAITGTAGRIFFNGGNFNGTVNLTKTGIGTTCNGGSTFNAPVTLTNASNFIWRMGNTIADNYNATAAFNNTGTSQLQIAYGVSANYTNDFIISATSGSVLVGGPSANVTLDNNIDVSGVTNATVTFQNCTFNQLLLTLILGTNGTYSSLTSTYNGVFKVVTSRFLSRESIYNQDVSIDRTNNTTPDYSYGGNIFNGDVSITLNGSVGGRFANILGDSFNSNLFVNHNGTSAFSFAHNGNNQIQGILNVNNQTGTLTFGYINGASLNINGTTTLNNNSIGTIRFAQNAGSTVNFLSPITYNNNGGGNLRFGNGGGSSNWSAGVNLSVGSHAGGTIQLGYVNAISPQTINIPNGILTINNSVWNGNVTFSAPDIRTANSTYNANARLTKNGAGISASTGGNVFNGTTEIINSGTGTFRMATVTGDDFNSNVNFIRNNGVLVPVYNATSTFSGDVIVTSTTTINFNGTASSFAEFDGIGTQNLSATSGTNLFRNVILNKPSGSVVLNNTMEINNVGTIQFNNSGILNLNNQVLKISNLNGSAISRTLGGILCESTTHTGRVEWAINTNTDVHEIPFINNVGEYVPFIVTLTSGNLGTVQVSTYGTSADNLPYPIGVTELLNNSAKNNSKYTADRFYVVIPSGSSYTANATFSYGLSEISAPNTIDVNSLKAQRWNGSLWEDPVGSVNVTLRQVTVYGITQFSPWTIADASEPLPVQFINFDAKLNGSSVDLSWTVANEKDNNYFSVERGIDGTNFYSIGKVNSLGNTSSTRTYEYFDFNPIKGISYYRIKQVDLNGSETFSQVRTVRFDELMGWVTYYPNPTKNQVIFNLSKTNATDVEVNVTNALGQSVWYGHLNPPTQREYTLEVSNWTRGIYFVNIKIDGKITTSKLILE